MAWEVRVSVAPDFRLYPSIESGSLIFCRLGYPKCQRTNPIKTPSKLQVCITQTGYNSLKRFGGEFEGNLSSEKVPLKKKRYLINRHFFFFFLLMFRMIRARERAPPPATAAALVSLARISAFLRRFSRD